MKIGLTTYSFDNKDFREQLSSMLKSGIKPDFIILHYGGIYKSLKGFNFLKKTLKQRKFRSISFILSYGKNITAPDSGYKLNEEDSKEVDRFISSAKVVHAVDINDASSIHTISLIGEALIVSNSGKLNSRVLETPNVIFLNVHASKLPDYRGMNNVEWALWENNEIYATIHRISKGIDEGDILLQEKIETEKSNLKTISEYREYCFFKSNELMGKAIRGYLDKKIFFNKQDVAATPLVQYYSMHPILKGYLNQKISGS
jgi:folate-dependent phosphoribosylglycinamide formyltransferase PurN